MTCRPERYGAPPFPSRADAGWLLFYPQAYAGVLLFTSRHVSGRRVVLDGTIAGLGGAALFSAGVVDFLASTTGAGDFAHYTAL
ncbi:hypothetical protein [Actinoplanes subglobosus]|uniref:Uncharacterized protein n=1 Tax=Actinoplanes subglobosus TaxID=1547892 RepID=A0ABV8J1D1_9ACTN